MEPPVIYFNQNYENTGDFITFNGLTAASYNTLDGSTFSTQIEFATYATSSMITKTDLLDGLIEKILIHGLLLQPIQLAHKDWLTDHGSWELNLVEMQFMFGAILLYLQCVL